MKRVFWKICLTALLALLCLTAVAEEMEVQIIAGPETEAATVSMDDIQIGSAHRSSGQLIFSRPRHTK